jgi:hypothetical protein
MAPLPDPVQRLPWYLDVAIRLGTSPVEWPDAIGCYERVYAALTATDGERKAKRWALKNTAWLIAAGVANTFR